MVTPDTFTIGLFVFILLDLFAIPFGLIIGKKLYQNIKQEELQQKGQVLQRIMKTYIVIQCIAWPLIMSLFTVLLILAKTTQLNGKMSALEVFLRALISSCRFFYVLILCYAGFNSLLVAICRYIFIVIVQHKDASTIKKIRSWVIAASIVIPVMVATLHEATVPLNSRWMGVLEKMVTPDNSTSVINSSYPIQNTTLIVHQSSIFTIFDEYVPTTIKFGIRVACAAMKLVIFSNVFEGCIYLHIYIRNRRSENKDSVNASLSEESRIKRNRKNTINLQMTIISWSLEFVAGLISLIIVRRSHLLPAGNVVVDSHISNYIMRVFIFFSPVFLNFILIPSSYLTNTAINKKIIIVEGWWKWLTKIFSPERVSPTQNEAQEENRNPVARSNHNAATSKHTREGSIRNPNDRLNSNHVTEHIPSVLLHNDVNPPIGLKVLRNNYM